MAHGPGFYSGVGWYARWNGLMRWLPVGSPLALLVALALASTFAPSGALADKPVASAFAAGAATADRPVAPVPSPSQLIWQRQELHAFVHFGPNTFSGAEWGS